MLQRMSCRGRNSAGLSFNPIHSVIEQCAKQVRVQQYEFEVNETVQPVVKSHPFSDCAVVKLKCKSVKFQN